MRTSAGSPCIYTRKCTAGKTFRENTTAFSVKNRRVIGTGSTYVLNTGTNQADARCWRLRPGICAADQGTTGEVSAAAMVPAVPAPVGRDGAAEATAATCTASRPPPQRCSAGTRLRGPLRACCGFTAGITGIAGITARIIVRRPLPPPSPPGPGPGPAAPSPPAEAAPVRAGQAGKEAEQRRPHPPPPAQWTRPGATTPRAGTGPARALPPRGGGEPGPHHLLLPPSPRRPFPGLRHGGGEGGQIIFICACKYMSILQTSSIDSLKHWKPWCSTLWPAKAKTSSLQCYSKHAQSAPPGPALLLTQRETVQVGNKTEINGIEFTPPYNPISFYRF